MWCSATDTHLKLLDRVYNAACFLTDGVLDCNLRSVAVLLSMLYKFRCKPMHPLCGALLVPCVRVDTLSGSTSKVVASHAEISRSSPSLTEAAPIYMYCALVTLRGYCSVKGGW